VRQQAALRHRKRQVPEASVSWEARNGPPRHRLPGIALRQPFDRRSGRRAVNTALVAIFAFSRRGSGARAWRDSADHQPDGSADGRPRCLTGRERAFANVSSAVSGWQPAVNSQNNAGNFHKRRRAQARRAFRSAGRSNRPLGRLDPTDQPKSKRFPTLSSVSTRCA
jgi:hypothetical protein